MLTPYQPPRRRGVALQRAPSSIALPRPLLRAMGRSLWREGGAATVQELNLVAARCAPILKTPGADLARLVLDAVVHHSAERLADDPGLATCFGTVLAMGPWASRSDGTQRELHVLRQAASDARNPLEDVIYSQVGAGEAAGSVGGCTNMASAAQRMERRGNATPCLLLRRTERRKHFACPSRPAGVVDEEHATLSAGCDSVTGESWVASPGVSCGAGPLAGHLRRVGRGPCTFPAIVSIPLPPT